MFKAEGSAENSCFSMTSFHIGHVRDDVDEDLDPFEENFFVDELIVGVKKNLGLKSLERKLRGFRLVSGT